MAKEYLVFSPVRISGVLYRENERVTCDPKDLAGVEHCVKPVEAKASKADAEAAAKASK